MPKHIQITSILLIDQNNMFLDAFTLLVNSYEEFNVIKSTQSGFDGLKYNISLNPDIIIISGKFVDIDVITFFEELSIQNKKTKIIILSESLSDHFIRASLDFGVLGIVSMQNSVEILRKAIQKVSKGKKYYCEVFSPLIIDSIQSKESASSPSFEKYNRLSSREKQVMIAMLRGLCIHEISDLLGISPKTVSAHKSNLFAKLEIKSMINLFELGKELELEY